MSKKDEKTIKALIDAGNPNAEALQKALEINQQENEERLVNQLVTRMKKIDNLIESEVEDLKAIRSAEKIQKKKVLAIDKAKSDFAKNGDWDVFVTTCRKNGVHIH